ncbi:MAG: OmpA family protein [Turneriella sp.]|nr:OmpA family protein [Turneriella sp.]
MTKGRMAATIVSILLTRSAFADMFYFPSEYKDVQDDRYALEIETELLQKDSKAERDKLFAEIAALRNELKIVNADHEKFRSDKGNEVARLQTQLREMERKLRENEEQSASRIKALEEKLAILRKKSGDREKELIDEHTAQEKKLRGELAALRAEATHERQRCAAELEKAHLEIENYRQMLADRKKKLEDLETQAKELEAKLKKEIEAGNLRIKRLKNKLVINMDDKILFSSGSAGLKPDILKTLDNIAEILSQNKKNSIVVEGHTDNIPIRTPRFHDNWQLSTERANSVLRAILKRTDLDPGRFSAAGFAEYQPIAPNDSHANRQLNRRVDLVIYPEL